MTASALTYLTSLEFLLNSLVTIFAFVGGCLLMALRRRIRTVEFTTWYGKVTQAGAQSQLDSLKVMLAGSEVENLHWGKIEVFNTSGEDLSAVNIHVTSGSGQLISEFTSVSGTANILWYSPEFAEQIRVPEGQQATERQLALYLATRRYLVPVFNRGQTLMMSYLISVPQGGFPFLGLSVEHKGIKTKYRHDIHRTFGVSTKRSAWVGLVSGLAVVVVSAAALNNVWIVGLLGFFYGCFAAPIGATLIRMARAFWSVVVR